ncbi:MAG TPA: hypothetical protein VFH00_14420 [Candidatus Nitrosotalea sp.]|nr:hypothetical protein [Candidatus Nitrosotalea sp.]
MRSLSELTGQYLVWKVEPGSAGNPDQAQRNYVLFIGDEPVVQAQAIWERMVSYELVMESSEGTYQVHMDLADPKRRSVVWKTGETHSAAGFELASKEGIIATGWINTANRQRLAWAHVNSVYEYVIFAPGGPRLITVSAVASLHIGGNPGQMTLAPEMAGDRELVPLVALGFALANEQLQLQLPYAPPGQPGA